MTKKNIDFEENLQTLESLIAQLETNELSLENSLETFEQGIKLTRVCQKALDEAEQKINILLEKNGEHILDPFESNLDQEV
jgi:exodeoxyribonuclease VII small subunit